MKIASKLNENQRTNFIGVIKRPPERYVAKIQHEGVSKWIGTYDTAKEAAEAYDKIAIELRRAHKARTNFPISDYVQSQIKETEENKADEQVQGIERVNQKGAVSRTQVETVSRDQANTNICRDVSNVRIKLKESGSSTLPVCNSFDSKQERGAGAGPDAQSMKIPGESDSKMNDKNMRGTRKLPSGNWMASIYHEGVHNWLGAYDTKQKAAKAFDKAAIELRGEHKARTNFPISDYVQTQIKETEENKVDEQMQGIERVNQKGAVSRTQVEAVSRDQANTNTRGDVSNVPIKLKESGSTVSVCKSFDSKQEHGEGADPEAQSMKIPGESDSKMNDRKTRGIRKLQSGNWMAKIYDEGVYKWLGAYDTAEKAARAYDKAAIELLGRGQKVQTNFPIPDYVEIQIKETEENKADERSSESKENVEEKREP